MNNERTYKILKIAIIVLAFIFVIEAIYFGYRIYERYQNTIYYSSINDCLKKDDNYNMIFINQHNDLVLSNILKEKTGYTVFDYEFYGKNLFYYDFLLWFVWKAIYYRL